MANIPVERTNTGIPPWLWILGLLLLGLLAWFLISALGDDDDDVVVAEDTTTEVVAPAAALDLSDVYVTRVVSDNAFFVASTPGGTDETLVYLEEEPTPGTATEGRYDVTEGQHLSITGTMEPTPADLTAWGLTPDEASGVGEQYVRATSLTVLDDAEMAEDMEDGMDDGAAAAGTASALAGDLSQRIGQSISLDGVRVTALAGDSTFYVGDGAERTLVVLEDLGESQTGARGTDGAFDINVGDVLDINGTVRSFDRTMRGTSTLQDADRTAAEARRAVIVIDGRGELSKQ